MRVAIAIAYAAELNVADVLAGVPLQGPCLLSDTAANTEI
jgi:hypothetical protein